MPKRGLDIFDHVWIALNTEPRRRDQVRVVVLGSPLRSTGRISLARRTGPYEIVPVYRKLQRIGTLKFERIARLRLNIDTHHVESGVMQAHGNAARTAIKVERFWASVSKCVSK